MNDLLSTQQEPNKDLQKMPFPENTALPNDSF